MTTIKDIAARLNLSASTVSYALRDHPKISEKTKKLVKEVAKEMNYVPNPVARIMQGQKSKIIGVFIRDYGGNFFGDILHGIRVELDENGYETVITSSVQSFKLLSNDFFEGTIVLGDSFNEKEALEFIKTGRKVVLLDRIFTASNASSVIIDNNKGIELALKKLLKAKHNKLYIICGPMENFDVKSRLKKAQEILENHPNINYTIIKGDFTKECGYEFAKEYQIEEQDCAILSLNDNMAIGIHSAIKDKKKIGKSISIIGFDDIELSSYLVPSLCSVGYDRVEWGKESARQILNLLENKDKNNLEIEVKLNNGKSVRQ